MVTPTSQKYLDKCVELFEAVGLRSERARLVVDDVSWYTDGLVIPLVRTTADSAASL
jgi:hypothetical protein